MLEQIFDTQEAAPEFMRPHLAEQDGKFVFRAELPGEVSGLKAALEAERKAAKEAVAKLKGYEGIDPEKAREMLAAAAKAEEEAAKAKGDWDSWKQQMLKTHEGEKQAWQQASTAKDERVKQLEAELERVIVDSQVTQEIVNAKGKAKLLRAHVGAKSVIENDQRVVRVYDEAGNVRYGKDGKPMTIAERLAEMKNDPEFMAAFEGTGAGGSGATNGTASSAGGNKTITRAALEQLSPGERAEFFRKGGTVTG